MPSSGPASTQPASSRKRSHHTADVIDLTHSDDEPTSRPKKTLKTKKQIPSSVSQASSHVNSEKSSHKVKKAGNSVVAPIPSITESQKKDLLSRSYPGKVWTNLSWNAEEVTRAGEEKAKKIQKDIEDARKRVEAIQTRFDDTLNGKKPYEQENKKGEGSRSMPPPPRPTKLQTTTSSHTRHVNTSLKPLAPKKPYGTQPNS
ncbi:hypothetical protein ACMFMG_000436 [Clarireedia jacksonii]